MSAGRECDCGQTVAVPDEGGLAELTAALAGEHTGEWSNVLELMPASCLETLTDLVRARAEQREAPSAVVGEGWKLVPVEPTPEMYAAVIAEKRSVVAAAKIWPLMLAAAPASDGR